MNPIREQISMRQVVLATLLGMLALFSPKLHADDGPPVQQDRIAALDQIHSALTKLRAKTDKAISDEIARLGNELFAEALAGTEGFASEALTFHGKFGIALDVVNEAGNEFGRMINGLFGDNIFDVNSGVTDNFERKIRDLLEERFRPATFDFKVHQAMKRFKTKVQAAESEAILELGLDIENYQELLRYSNPLEMVFEQESLRLANRAKSITGGDLLIDVGSQVFSILVGDMVGDQVTRNDAGQAERFAVTIGTGLAIDEATARLIRSAGHKPEGNLANEYLASIRNLNNALFEGLDGVAEFHLATSLEFTHRDPAVRQAAARLVKALSDNANIGLRNDFSNFAMRVYIRICEQAFRNRFGPDGLKPSYVGPGSKNTTPVEQLLAQLNAAIIRWEGMNR